MLAYEHLNGLLADVEAESCAAECHGFLCGQLCISRVPQEELWQEFLDVQSNDDDLVDACYQEIKILLTDTSDEMQSPDLDFQPLLPDDSASLEERVNALGEWCHGFLNGYGIGAGGRNDAVLTEISREILEDFTHISRVGIDEQTNEEDEAALMELIEYVRMGTLIIFDEMTYDSNFSNGPEIVH